MNSKSIEQNPSLQSSIDDLCAMAFDAIKQYESQLTAGSEPAYPHWADKLKAICAFAQQALEVQRCLPALHGYRANPRPN